MSGSVKIGLLGFAIAFFLVTSCHDEEVMLPREPGEGRTDQHRMENRVAGDTTATDGTPGDTTAMDATKDTTSTDVIPATADTVVTDDNAVTGDTTTTDDPPVPGDTTAADATPVTGENPSEDQTATEGEAPTAEETPPAEETTPGEETPPVEETAPGEETPPVEETAPGEETPPVEETAPDEETPPAEETPPMEETPPAVELPSVEEPAPVDEPPIVIDAPLPTSPLTNLIYDETVEGSSPFSTAHDWDIGSWAYALQFVNSPVYNGTKAARFEIQEDQELVANGKRAEITIVKGAEGDIGKDTWYSFAVYFPSVGYEYDDEREVINQWFQGDSPATSLRTHRDRILLESGNTLDSRVKYDIAPITKDTWHTFVIHFIHSYGSDGLIELWQNGTKKLTIRGGNMYDTFLPKWKIGLYKSAFKYGTSDVTRRIIYFDNVRVGDETSTFETMDPRKN